MDASIAFVDANEIDAELRSLESWLSDEPELRGSVRRCESQLRAGVLGSTSDVLVVALGSSGAITVVATAVVRALLEWIKNRRTWPGNRGEDMRMTFTGPWGTLELEILNASNVEESTRRLMAIVEMLGDHPAS